MEYGYDQEHPLDHETIKPPTLAQKLRSIVGFITDKVCFPSAVVTASTVAINYYLNNGRQIDGWVLPILGAQLTITSLATIYNLIRPVEDFTSTY